MAQKLYDLAVKTGEYRNRDGETKGRYVNVGSVMANDDGGKFIILHRHFNPAGVPNPDNKDSVILSMFEPRDQDDAPARSRSSSGGSRSGGGGSRQSAPPDDDIPF